MWQESLSSEINESFHAIICWNVPQLWLMPTFPWLSRCTIHLGWNVTLMENIRGAGPVSRLHQYVPWSIFLTDGFFSPADRRFYCWVLAELWWPGHPPSGLFPAGSRVSVHSVVSLCFWPVTITTHAWLVHVLTMPNQRSCTQTVRAGYTL